MRRDAVDEKHSSWKGMITYQSTQQDWGEKITSTVARGEGGRGGGSDTFRAHAYTAQRTTLCCAHGADKIVDLRGGARVENWYVVRTCAGSLSEVEIVAFVPVAISPALELPAAYLVYTRLITKRPRLGCRVPHGLLPSRKMIWIIKGLPTGKTKKLATNIPGTS